MELRLDERLSRDEAVNDAARKARAFLEKHAGDLLIWGQLHSMGERRVVELRFVSAGSDGSEDHRFGFGDKLLLEPDFGPEMGSALAAVAGVMAAPVTQDAGKYLARTLIPIASRLVPLIRSIPSSMRANDRASLLFSYGMIEARIGEQSGQAIQLEAAVAAYRGALRDWTRERAPLQWATAQNNLGNVLRILGERENGTERLEEAIAAYREALCEQARERVPLQWATTQNNFGNALMRLGEREKGTEHLEQAVGALREALRERTRKRVPLQWATTQNNLGIALARLGEREKGTERLKAAVAACREALREWTRERVPLYWAAAQNNLGTALTSLGKREKGTRHLEAAVAAFREALRERTRERVPGDWAMTQNNIGVALRVLGEREDRTEPLEEAIAAYSQAFEVLGDASADFHPMAQAIVVLAQTVLKVGNLTRSLNAEDRSGPDREQ